MVAQKMARLSCAHLNRPPHIVPLLGIPLVCQTNKQTNHNRNRRLTDTPAFFAHLLLVQYWTCGPSSIYPKFIGRFLKRGKGGEPLIR